MNLFMLRWSEFVTGLQRRQYVSEILKAIQHQDRMRLTDLDILGITHEVGLAIEDPTKDWYEFLLTILSTKIDASKNELATIIRRRAYLTDALTYIQYGNPEHILIVKSDAKEMSSKSQPP